MQYHNLADFLDKEAAALAKGPVALIFIEDAVEVESTIRHHQNLGFRQILVFGPKVLHLPKATLHIIYDMAGADALTKAVNAVIQAAPEIWLYYCFNGEYLFYPFCESRSVGEMIAFTTEERRKAILTYVVDLYAGDLEKSPNGVALTDAWLDTSGYYAQAREGEMHQPKPRQLDFFGGLRWRFEEHIPYARRKIDRVALFRAKKGLELRPDHTFTDDEYNTYACEWHHNITASICSFRTAKALKRNPGSTFDIETFRWQNSHEFKWHSQQLLDLGLMESGQWF